MRRIHDARKSSEETTVGKDALFGEEALRDEEPLLDEKGVSEPEAKEEESGRFFAELERVLNRTGGSSTIIASMTGQGLRVAVTFKKGSKDDEVELPPSFVVTGTGNELDGAEGLEAFLSDAAEGCKSLTEQRALTNQRIEKLKKAIKAKERKAKTKAKKKAKAKASGGKNESSSGSLFSADDADEA